MKTAKTFVIVNFKGLRRILHNAQIMPEVTHDDLIYIPKAWAVENSIKQRPEHSVNGKVGFSEGNFPPALWHSTLSRKKSASTTHLVIDKIGDGEWKATVHTGQRNTAHASYYKLVLEERERQGASNVVPIKRSA
jgi:hypothetical protein